ncbi:hypothetical protein E2542_SST16193 [Spatholobus suberectus]|nr:hypothetical protein E2542_SST16193 [Spatholobus suberectus]
MEVEVVVPPVDFNFDSNCSSPFMTAPSSPQRFGNGNFFFSAPTSPTRGAPSFFHDSPSSSVPFHWEQKPGVPKPNGANRDEDFEFNFSGHLDRPSLSADELFDGGKIRPLKPPPRLQSPSPTTSPRSRICHAKKKDFDPFAEAMKETRRTGEQEQEEEKKRGRERVSASVGRKTSRSLSPLRISDIVCDSEDKGVSSSASNNKSSFLSSIPFTRKWRFRDFLLFRSASEGRAADKDPLRKYVALSKNEDVRNSSFRSSESSGSVSKRRGPVSAHELHYTLNRAAAEEMKKKTFLPYKHGLLGCLGFNPGMHHISKGIGSLTRS